MSHALKTVRRVFPRVLGWLNWVAFAYLIGIAIVAGLMAVGLLLIR